MSDHGRIQSSLQADYVREVDDNEEEEGEGEESVESTVKPDVVGTTDYGKKICNN